MKTPLYDAVKAYLDRDAARFHMPGHKGVGEGPFAELYPWDVTEVAGCDSLYEASGPLLELEEAFARLYGARRTLLSAGGATLCIQTMLALACPPGSTLVLGRNAHRAAVNALALLDLAPVWVYPEGDAGDWFSGRYGPASVEAALEAHPKAAAVYLTSPDYFGVQSDLRGVAAVCAARGVPLLVDNAHGAHLKFLPERYGAPHPADCGAAACCDSLHKTLPALTGAAALHLFDERLVEGAKGRMALFGSTSPSYPILLSCERAARYADERAREEFDQVCRAFDQARRLCLERGLALPLGAADPAKLAAAFGPLGMSAAGFGDHLRAHGIEPEYLSGTACVLMGTGFNRPEDFARLRAALGALAPSGASAPAPSCALPRLRQAMRPRRAVFAPAQRVPVGEAAGRVAAAAEAPCPPGAPLAMPGEELDAAACEALRLAGVESVLVVR